VPEGGAPCDVLGRTKDSVACPIAVASRPASRRDAPACARPHRNQGRRPEGKYAPPPAAARRRPDVAGGILLAVPSRGVTVPWVASLSSPPPFHRIVAGRLLRELLGEADEDAFGAADVAEAVNAFVIDDFVDHGRAELGEPGEGVVEVLDGEHDAQVPQGVHGGGAMIG